MNVARPIRWLAAALLLLPASLAYPMPAPGDGPPTELGITTNTGDARLGMAIPVPPGTGALAPTVALQYSSSNGDGPFGMGWALEFGEIRRSLRSGIPTYQDADDVFELGGQPLVMNAAESTQGSTRYHTLVETFARIVHTRSDSADQWVVTRPDGIQLRFGASNASRVRNASGEIFRWMLDQVEDPYGNRIVFEHMIEEGEAYPQRVRYTLRGSSATPVGTERTITFEYQTRPDPSLTFMGGVRRAIDKRVDRIVVRTGDQVFRRMELTYADELSPPTKAYRTKRTRLARMQFFGVGNVQALPPQNFAYSDPGDAAIPQGPGGHWSTGSLSVPEELEMPNDVALETGVRVATVNPEDGFPDLIVAYQGPDGAITRAVYLGTGNGWNPTPDAAWTQALRVVQGTSAKAALKTVRAADVPTVHPSLRGGTALCRDGTTAPRTLTFAEGVLFKDPRSRQELTTFRADTLQEFDLAPTWRVVDLNGDGLDDLVRSNHVGEAVTDFVCGNPNPTTTERNQGQRYADVFLNDGTGWARDATLSNSLPPFAILVANGAVRRYDLDPRFTDLDGDRRVDLVVMGFTRQDNGDGRVYGSQAYLNKREGWARAPAFDPPTTHRLIEGDARSTPLEASSLDRAVRFVDINRDGLSDTIKTTISGTCQEPAFTESGVWLNVGTGWCDGNSGTVCNGAAAKYMPPVSFETEVGTCNGLSAQLVFTDLNGDGLIDLLQTDSMLVDSGPTSDGRRAWLQSPSAPSATIKNVWLEAPQFMPPLATALRLATSGLVQSTGVIAADVNADSTLDLVSFKTGGVNSATGQVRFSDRLARWENDRGGVVEYAYASASSQRDATLADLADDVVTETSGKLFWTVDPVLVSLRASGAQVVPTMQSFRYAQPRFDAARQLSLGFALVTATVPTARSQRVFFSQTLGSTGQPTQVDVVDPVNGQLLRRSTIEHEVLPGNDREVGDGSTDGAFVGRVLSQTDAQYYGSDATSGAEVVQTFEYGPQNGDRYAGYGFVTRTTTERPTGTFVTTRSMRAPDEAAWIVGLPEEVLVTSGTQELLRSAYRYSDEGRTIEVTAYDGPRGKLDTATPRTASLSYDEYGNVRVRTDPAGRVTEFCYDGDETFESGEDCEADAPDETHGIAVAVRDPLGQVTVFVPDVTTGQIKITQRLYSGDSERIEFDAFGRPTQRLFTPEDGDEVLLSETSYFPFAAGVGAGVEYEVNRDRIAPGSSTAVRTATYRDGFGREMRNVSEAPPLGGQPRYVGVASGRDLNGLRTSTSLPATCGSDPHCSFLTAFDDHSQATIETRDALGRPIEVDSPDGVAKFDYRSAVRMHPDAGSKRFDAVLALDLRGYLTQRIVDGDRVVWVEECTNAPFDDPASVDIRRATCQSPETTFYRYEPTGELAEIYDALVTEGYDDPAQATLRYVYDSLGRLTESYDINRTGVISTAYNDAGQIREEVNARGQTITYEYDGLDRLKTFTYPVAAGMPVQQYVFTYDDRTREIAGVQQKRGETILYTESFDYDPLGRRARETLAFGRNSALITEYDLDLLGRRTQIRYPDSNTDIAYEYEGAYLKRVCELGDAESCTETGATPYLSDIDYDGLGRETELAGNVSPTRPQAPTMRFTYRLDNNRLRRIEVTNPLEGRRGELLDLTYTYDPAGNVTAVDDTSPVFGGAADVSLSATYTYDARNRIASRTRAGQTKHFSYDAIGNLTGKALDEPGTTNQTYDATHRHRLTRANDMSYGYDADGNVTQRGTQVLGYDALHRMTCIGTSAAPCATTFSYAPDATRVAGGGGPLPVRVYAGDLFEWEPATGRATARVYALGRQIAYKEIDRTTLRSGLLVGGTPLENHLSVAFGCLACALAGALLWALLRGGLMHGLAARPAYGGVALATALLVAVPPSAWASFNTPPGQGTYRRWIWEDPLGSGVHITDEAGSPVQQRAFEPFGEVARERSSEPTRQTFATHDFESALGLYYMKARWYDPTTGRFLSTDPLIRDVAAPQSINAYSYAENDPLNRIDPTGLFSFSQLLGDLINGIGGGFSFGFSFGDFFGGIFGGIQQVGTGFFSEPGLPTFDGGIGVTADGTYVFINVLDPSGLQEDADSVSANLDDLQTALGIAAAALDLTGVGAPLGAALDITNGIISLTRGDYTGAIASTLAIIPGVGTVLGAGYRAAKAGDSVLDDISRAAFQAADDVDTFIPKNKHLLGGGSQSKARFASSDVGEVRGIVQEALRSPNALFLPNPNLPDTFRVVTDVGRVIGVKGQTAVRAIVGLDGKVINAFPVHTR